MVEIDFKIDANNIAEIKEATAGAISKALEEIGLVAEGYAKMLCPVDTGNLRNSITHEQEGENTEVIGTAVEYAAYVEMGTQKMKAQPYLEPAITNHTSEYQSIVEETLHNA